MARRRNRGTFSESLPMIPLHSSGSARIGDLEAQSNFESTYIHDAQTAEPVASERSSNQAIPGEDELSNASSVRISQYQLSSNILRTYSEPAKALRIGKEAGQSQNKLKAVTVAGPPPLPSAEVSLQGERSGKVDGSNFHAVHPNSQADPTIKDHEDAPQLESPILPTGPRPPTAPNVGGNKEEEGQPTRDVSDSWSKCAEAVWQRENDKLANLKESINNLLIFSGLFSAILTAFIVPFYGMLKTSPPDASAHALIVISSQLMAISGQLNAFATGTVHLNVTQPLIPSAATLSPAPPTPQTTISTCTLWLIALVCSLGAAMIEIVVNQWLQHHGDATASASRQSIRIWYFRDQGFIEWKVQGIIDTLPVLLQISVALFLVGLVQILFTMNVVVAVAVMALVAVLLSFSVGTAFIPAFASECPYKSPQAWWCFLLVQWLTKQHESFYRFLCRSVILIGISLHSFFDLRLSLLDLMRHLLLRLCKMLLWIWVLPFWLSLRLILLCFRLFGLLPQLMLLRRIRDFRGNIMRTYNSWRDQPYMS